jgi:hypothetical protein
MNNANSAKKPEAMIFTVSFWGAQYREMFLHLSLASLLAPGNIPSLTDRRNSRFLLCTTSEDWYAIQTSPTFQRARDWIEFEYVELRRPVPPFLRPIYGEKLRRAGNPVPDTEAAWRNVTITPKDVLIGAAYSELEQIGQTIGIELTVHQHYSLRIHFMTLGHKFGACRAFEQRASVFFVGADHVMADGAIPELERILVSGRRVVISAILRFEQEGCLKAMESSGRLRTGEALVFSPRQLVELSFSNMHAETACFEFDSPYFCDVATSASWRVPGDKGVVIHNLNFFPLIVSYKEAVHHDTDYFDIGGTIDGQYISRHFDSARDIEMIEDSDRLFVASLTPASDYFYPVTDMGLKNSSLFGEAYKTYLMRNTLFSNMGDSIKRRFYGMPIRLHSADIGPEWDATEARARRIAMAALGGRSPLDFAFDAMVDLRRRLLGRRMLWPSGEICDRWISNTGGPDQVRVSPLAPFLEGGKWYWEVYVRDLDAHFSAFGSAVMTGAITIAHSLGSEIGRSASGKGWGFRADGLLVEAGSEFKTLAGYGTDLVIQVALDIDSGQIWFGCNDSWLNEGNPAKGVSASCVGLPHTIQPVVSLRGGHQGALRAIARVRENTWQFSCPAGFKSLTLNASLPKLPS